MGLKRAERSQAIYAAARDAVAVFVKHELTFREMKTAMNEIRNMHESVIDGSAVSDELLPAIKAEFDASQQNVERCKRKLVEALGEQALEVNA